MFRKDCSKYVRHNRDITSVSNSTKVSKGQRVTLSLRGNRVQDSDRYKITNSIAFLLGYLLTIKGKYQDSKFYRFFLQPTKEQEVS